MFDWLIDIDKSLLLTINGAHAPWADTVFWQVSQPTTWLPLYALLIVFLCLKFRKQRSLLRPFNVQLSPFTILIALAMIAIAVGGSDLICAQVIKPLVSRPRPTHDTEIGALVHIVNGYYGGAYGFCSNHAANTMACATLCSLIFTHGKLWQVHCYVTLPLMIWVMLNCYSRMYLGVHYPLDILAGLAVGGLIAWGVWAVGRDCLFPHDDCVRRDASE